MASLTILIKIPRHANAEEEQEENNLEKEEEEDIVILFIHLFIYTVFALICANSRLRSEDARASFSFRSQRIKKPSPISGPHN